MTEIWTRQWHVEYGRHSGIPECCIEYYVDREGAPSWGDDGDLHYQRCPRCRATDNRVELHYCNVGCEFERQLNEYWASHGKRMVHYSNNSVGLEDLTLDERYVGANRNLVWWPEEGENDGNDA